MSSEDPGRSRDDHGTANLAAMRALAHPTRVAIVKLLGEHPALTATECGNTLSLSAKTCSYHLQTLAGAGLVAELPGAGRNRPWRLVNGASVATPTTINPLRHTRDKKLAARVRRETGVLSHAVDALTHAALDSAWSGASTVYDRPALMSPDELAAWGEDVERLTRRHLRRVAQSGELGDAITRQPVRLLFYGFPERSGAGQRQWMADESESARHRLSRDGRPAHRTGFPVLPAFPSQIDRASAGAIRDRSGSRCAAPTSLPRTGGRRRGNRGCGASPRPGSHRGPRPAGRTPSRPAAAPSAAPPSATSPGPGRRPMSTSRCRWRGGAVGARVRTTAGHFTQLLQRQPVGERELQVDV